MYSCASAHGRASSWLRLSPCPLPDEMHPRRRRGRTSERIATRHRRRGVIDPRSPALHADPATPAPGKSWLLRHGHVQREGPAQGQAADLVARGMAAAAARRRSVGTWSRDGSAASSRRCWPRSGDATQAQARVGAPARPGLWRGVRLAILRRAAWRQRLRSVGTWSRDGNARARGATGRAPETLLRPKPAFVARAARNRLLRNGRTTERARTAQAEASHKARRNCADSAAGSAVLCSGSAVRCDCAAVRSDGDCH